MGAINANKGAKFGEFFKRLFWEDGLVKDSKKKARQSVTEKIKKNAKEELIGINLADARDMAENGKISWSKVTSDTRYDMHKGKSYAEYAGLEGELGEAVGMQTRVDILNSKNTGISIKETAINNMDAANRAISIRSKINTAKGYFANPWERMRDESLDQATRNLAAWQLTARAGATGAGVMATGTVMHDMFSDKDDRVGLGGGVMNTLGGATLIGGAAGITSMIRKL